MKPYVYSILAMMSCCNVALSAVAPLSLSIATNHNFVKDPDIVVIATLTNTSPETIMFMSGDSVGMRSFGIEVHDGNGKAAPESAYYIRSKRGLSITSALPPPLAPGKAFTTSLDITRLFDLEAPGTYVIQVSRRLEFGGGEIRSNTLVVTILPPPVVNGGRARVVPASAVPPIASSGPLGKDLVLRIEGDQPEIFTGKDVDVGTMLTNVSKRDITIPLYGEYTRYVMQMRNTNGEMVPETPLARALQKEVRRMLAQHLIAPQPPFPLRAEGGRLGGMDNIAQYFEMASPGTYFVQMYLNVPEDMGGGEIRSNVLAITVKTRTE